MGHQGPVYVSKAHKAELYITLTAGAKDTDKCYSLPLIVLSGPAQGYKQYSRENESFMFLGRKIRTSIFGSLKEVELSKNL